jgi:predicted O-linked N-acetylglucosamine transferase (SPINDLY family)
MVLLKNQISKLILDAKVLHRSNSFGEAEKIYRALLTNDPDNPHYLNLLGISIAQAGDPSRSLEAVEFLERSIKILPNYSAYQINLGVVLQDLGEFERAKSHYDLAILLDKKNSDAYYNYGKLFKQLGLIEESLSMYKQALLADPNRHDALVNISNIFYNLGDYMRAIKFLELSFKIAPKSHLSIINLANTYRKIGKHKTAIKYYQKSLRIFEHDGLRIKMLLTVPIIYKSQEHISAIRSCFITDLNSLTKAKLRLSDPVLEIASTNFFLAYQGELNCSTQKKIADLLLKACPKLNFISPHCKSIVTKPKKIKIGFLSAYFRQHSVGKLMQGLISSISRKKFEVIIFITDDLDVKNDPISRKICESANKLVRLPDNTFDSQITVASETLDILFYPDIGMDIRTYFLAFSRLAHIQCVTWGHPDTTGIPNIDFFISSILIEPVSESEHYSEKLYKLNTLPTFYLPIQIPKKMKNRFEFGLPSSCILYLCSQNIIKYHPDIDIIFTSILQKLPSAKIVILGGVVNEWTNELTKRWSKTIPDVADRIIVLSRQSPEDFLALQSSVDIILDTPYFSGGNTSLESFFLGKPIVTLESNLMRGRVTAGMYRSMGIDDCIAYSIKQYIQIAVKLADSQQYREKIKEKILESKHILFENVEVIKEFEKFFISEFNKIITVK